MIAWISIPLYFWHLDRRILVDERWPSPDAHRARFTRKKHPKKGAAPDLHTILTRHVAEVSGYKLFFNNYSGSLDTYVRRWSWPRLILHFLFYDCCYGSWNWSSGSLLLVGKRNIDVFNKIKFGLDPFSSASNCCKLWNLHIRSSPPK